MTTRPELRGPGARVLRLIGYRSVPEVMSELARRSRRPSHIEGEQVVAHSTFHRRAPELIRVQAITRRVVPGPPRQVVYGLGRTGPDLCGVIDVWIELLRAAVSAPGGQVDWRAPIGFLEAWAAGVIQALLDGPLSLSEVEMIVRPLRPGLTGHQVKRLLVNNFEAGFFISDGERFALAELGRHAIGGLAASARFERKHIDDPIPIGVDDIVTALRAHLPLLELPEDKDGIYEFTVKADSGKAMAMAWAEFRGGRAVANGRGTPPQAATHWAQATIKEWIEAVMDHRPRDIQAAGERQARQGVSNVVDELYLLFYRRP